jgi:hypothetical protein
MASNFPTDAKISSFLEVKSTFAAKESLLWFFMKSYQYRFSIEVYRRQDLLIGPNALW